MAKPLHVALEDMLMSHPGRLKIPTGNRVSAAANSVAKEYGAQVTRIYISGVFASSRRVVMDIKPLCFPPNLSVADIIATAEQIKDMGGYYVRMHRGDNGFGVYSIIPQSWLGGLTPDHILQVNIGSNKNTKFAEPIEALLGLRLRQTPVQG